MHIILGALALLGFVLILGTESKFKVVEASRYRFTGRVTPALNPIAIDAMTDALKKTGAEILSVHNGQDGTIFTYEMTATADKEFTLNKPAFVLGDTSLTITNIEQV